MSPQCPSIPFDDPIEMLTVQINSERKETSTS